MKSNYQVRRTFSAKAILGFVLWIRNTHSFESHSVSSSPSVQSAVQLLFFLLHSQSFSIHKRLEMEMPRFIRNHIESEAFVWWFLRNLFLFLSLCLSITLSSLPFFAYSLIFQSHVFVYVCMHVCLFFELRRKMVWVSSFFHASTTFLVLSLSFLRLIQGFAYVLVRNVTSEKWTRICLSMLSSALANIYIHQQLQFSS